MELHQAAGFPHAFEINILVMAPKRFRPYLAGQNRKEFSAVKTAGLFQKQLTCSFIFCFHSPVIIIFHESGVYLEFKFSPHSPHFQIICIFFDHHIFSRRQNRLGKYFSQTCCCNPKRVCSIRTSSVIKKILKLYAADSIFSSPYQEQEKLHHLSLNRHRQLPRLSIIKYLQCSQRPGI